MAVYKSKRGESSVQFIETARQLEARKQLEGATKDGQILQQTICVIAQRGGDCVMTEWQVVLVIIALFGFITAVVTPIVKLNTNITKLTSAVERL
jgi:hypothetical protein